MTINEISSIGDALFHLRGLTGRVWSEAEFIGELIRLRLPVYAVASASAKLVHRDRVNGKQVTTLRPDLQASYVTLLQDEIEQLARGGQTVTDRPAWVFGDLPYRSWSEILAHRAANHRVVSNWEVDHGEWMGESDVFFFADSIGVTPATTIVVPRHTISEIARSAASHREPETPLMAAQTFPTIHAHALNTAIVKAEDTQGSSTAIRQADRNTWDQHQLRRLLEESRMPGATQSALGAKYDVSRQFISKQLKQARWLFDKQKPSPFDALKTKSKK
jgi:hypothetical protein